MRRIVLATTLFLAGCATAPEKPAEVSPLAASPHRPSDVLGLSAGELVQRFGNPALQIREGAGLKMQFRRRGCILDAYLYSGATGGVERVSHVDTRYPSGADMNQQSCIAALQSP